MIGEQLIFWTIRFTLTGYGVFLLGFAAFPHNTTWRFAAKWVWLAACGLFIAHLVSAFQFYHLWSHQHAVKDTAARTAEMIGVAFGEGILFSYFFALIWLADALYWSIVGDGYFQRNRFTTWAIHGYMAFIIFNGAIVFEDGAVRWASVGWCFVLAIVFAWRVWSESRDEREETQTAGD